MFGKHRTYGLDSLTPRPFGAPASEPLNRYIAQAKAGHRARVRGSRGAADEIPRLFPPTPADFGDELENAYEDVLNIAQEARDYAARVNFNAYPREAWEGPLLDIYTARRNADEALQRLTAILKGREAQAESEGNPPPTFNTRAQASLREAQENLDYAVRVADALYLGWQDVQTEKLTAARERSKYGGWDGALMYLADLGRNVPAAAQDFAGRAGEALGTGFREAARASFPWGPLLVGGAVLVAVVAVAGQRKR